MKRVKTLFHHLTFKYLTHRGMIITIHVKSQRTEIIDIYGSYAGTKRFNLACLPREDQRLILGMALKEVIEAYKHLVAYYAGDGVFAA